MRRKNCSALVALLVGCQLTPPPVDPSLAARKAEADQAVARAEADAAAAETDVTALREHELELEARATEKEQINRAHAQKVADAESAVGEHSQALSRARELGESCKKKVTPLDDEAVKLRGYLVQFQRDPERDASIESLESCRKLIKKRETVKFRSLVKEARTQLAIDIEDLFDERNPIYRGRLKARIKGSELRVSMRGNFEGRARHSQSEVDSWCSAETGFVFSRIVLKNSHGTFTCKPPLSAKETEEAYLAEKGVATSWTPPTAGDTIAPTLVAPLPPATATATEQTELTSVRASLEQARSKQFDANQRAQEAAARRQALDGDYSREVQAWKSDRLQTAKRTQTAGLVVGGLGVVGLVVGAYGSYAQRETQRELDAERANADTFENVPGLEPDEEKIAELEERLERQETTTVVGYAVGASLLVTGAVLYLAGRSRRAKLRGITVSATGLQGRF